MRRYYPLAELSRLEDTFDKFVDRFFSDFFPTRWEKEESLPGIEWTPAVDLMEKEDHFILKLEIPGIKKEDIDISVSDDVVTVKGELKKIKKDKGETYYLAEMCCGSFGRSVKLPHEIDSNKVEATLKDGVLELKLPKKEIHKPKVIEVKVK